MVVNELRGEKIDVVPWSANPAELVANALQPAKVKEVRIDEATSTALVIVPDYQLSLAIGKEGQNARLAARLTGWRIDIKSEAQVADESRPPVAAPVAVPVASEAGRRAGGRLRQTLLGDRRPTPSRPLPTGAGSADTAGSDEPTSAEAPAEA